MKAASKYRKHNTTITTRTTKENNIDSSENAHNRNRPNNHHDQELATYPVELGAQHAFHREQLPGEPPVDPAKAICEVPSHPPLSDRPLSLPNACLEFLALRISVVVVVVGATVLVEVAAGVGVITVTAAAMVPVLRVLTVVMVDGGTLKVVTWTVLVMVTMLPPLLLLTNSLLLLTLLMLLRLLSRQ